MSCATDIPDDVRLKTLDWRDISSKAVGLSAQPNLVSAGPYRAFGTVCASQMNIEPATEATHSISAMEQVDSWAKTIDTDNTHCTASALTKSKVA